MVTIIHNTTGDKSRYNLPCRSNNQRANRAALNRNAVTHKAAPHITGVQIFVQQFTPAGCQAIADLAGRYHLSFEAVAQMLVAVNQGGGSMAQFNCVELGGSGQWMRGGMTMVGDLFNTGLQSTVNNLCEELSQLLTSTQVFPIVPNTPFGTQGGSQWPTDLGTPFSSGSQNETRYAIFAGRLAVETQGNITVYDTLDHNIGGVSQQQGGNASLNFTSQYGTLAVNQLPVVYSKNAIELSAPSTNFAHAQQTPAAQSIADDAQTISVSEQGSNNGKDHSNHNVSDDFHSTQSETLRPTPAPVQPESAIEKTNDSSVSSSAISVDETLDLIEKLAKLHQSGLLEDDEFSAKKQELLARL